MKSVACLVCGCLLMGALSEDEQLALLEKADAYYHEVMSSRTQPERARVDTGIQLYEEVLREVELAWQIRLEVLSNLGALHVRTPPEAPGDYSHWDRACACYERVVDEAPKVNERVLYAHSHLGYMYGKTGHPARAESHYMRLRGLGEQLTEEEREALGPALAQQRNAALTGLAMLYEEHAREAAAGTGGFGVHMGDPDVAAELARRAKPRVDRQLNQTTEATFLALPSEDESVASPGAPLPRPGGGTSPTAIGPDAKPGADTRPMPEPAKQAAGKTVVRAIGLLGLAFALLASSVWSVWRKGRERE
ncbi:MAG: hypothetical protein JXR94_05040 [Candidatus Hydrogenedentes bacterium]|nr:hypothetical protein [Candidatus Hydrogenedentota bacterium]